MANVKEGVEEGGWQEAEWSIEGMSEWRTVQSQGIQPHVPCERLETGERQGQHVMFVVELGQK